MKPRGKFEIVEVRNPSGKISWQVKGTKLDGARIRDRFETEALALATKQRLECEVVNVEPPPAQITRLLTGEQLRDAERAFVLLTSGSLVDAVRYYMENYSPVNSQISLVRACPLFLKAKEYLRKKTLHGYKYGLKILVDVLPDRVVNDIGPDMLKRLLEGSDPIPGHPATKRPWSLCHQETLLRIFSAFFSWAVDEGYCATNPASKVKLKQVRNDEVEPAIFPLAQLQRLLDVIWAYADGLYAAYLVLATWAALRPTETSILAVDTIDFEEGWVRVSGAVAKTRSRRLVELMPNALLMLRVLRDKGVLQNKSPNISRDDWSNIRALAGLRSSQKATSKWCFLPCEERKRKVHRDLGFRAPGSLHELKPWVRDGLRHTGISHHLSWFHDENRTALWAGNSPNIIHKHYKGLVSSTEAQLFWTMLPTSLKEQGITVNPPDGGKIHRA